MTRPERVVSGDSVVKPTNAAVAVTTQLLLTAWLCVVAPAKAIHFSDTTCSIADKSAGVETTVAAEETSGADTAGADSTYHNPQIKVALVLGGGGARGTSHVGVLKVLKEANIPFHLVVGTSMGAIVGGFYCAGLPLSDIEEMFTKRKLMKSYMSAKLAVRLVTMPIFIMPRLVYHPYDGLYWGVRFRHFLNKHLPDDEKLIEELKIPYAAVAVDLVSGKAETLNKGLLYQAMQASSAVPGLRKPIQIGDGLFVDGGVLANVPVEQATELGADVVIAVNADEKMQEVPIKTFRKMGSVSRRMVTLQLDTLDRPHVNKACVIIHPDVTGIGLLSTSKRDAVRAIKAGEDAARQALPEIKRCLNDAGVKF